MRRACVVLAADQLVLVVLAADHILSREDERPQVRRMLPTVITAELEIAHTRTICRSLHAHHPKLDYSLSTYNIPNMLLHRNLCTSCIIWETKYTPRELLARLY
jgi:hypothetical protein